MRARTSVPLTSGLGHSREAGGHARPWFACTSRRGRARRKSPPISPRRPPSRVRRFPLAHRPPRRRQRRPHKLRLPLLNTMGGGERSCGRRRSLFHRTISTFLGQARPMSGDTGQGRFVENGRNSRQNWPVSPVRNWSKSPQSCRTCPTLSKKAQNRPTWVAIAPNWLKSPRVGRSRPESPEIARRWPEWPEIARHWTKMAGISRNRTESGRIRPRSREIGQNRTKLSEIMQNSSPSSSPEFRRHRPRFGRLRWNLVAVAPELADAGRIWSGSRPNWSKSLPGARVCQGGIPGATA